MTDQWTKVDEFARKHFNEMMQYIWYGKGDREYCEQLYNALSQLITDATEADSQRRPNAER